MRYSCIFLLIRFLVRLYTLHAFRIEEINLPEKHVSFYFNNYPDVAARCDADRDCPYKSILGQKKCWGYEPDCKPEESFSRPSCTGDHKGWVKSKEEQINTFYHQGDFGYVRDQLNELTVMCEPTLFEDSSLECSKHMRFCRGRNIMLNFTSLLNRKEMVRYHMDVLSDGDIGGRCRLHKKRLEAELDQISPLQSWGPEIRFFKELHEPAKTKCDIHIEKPTFIMKIDATVNMYHHFCDFFNLYASQHVNNSHPSSFSTDVRILIWETYKYRSSFGETWEAFTQYPLWDLNSFKGKTVCFKNVVFPLLPRMIFGLYYNTPIIWGCEGSGLFRAFSEHILHRLGVDEEPSDKVRITFLSRESAYRNILNEGQLINQLKSVSSFSVKRVVFNKELSLKEQLEIVRNTDIFIGIHGAGLTHLLFLPDWAVVFEVYNCEDEHCYRDLARLRGVKYVTWTNKDKLYQQDEGHHPDGGAHAKFTNYRFDVDEFMGVVRKAAGRVKKDQRYRNLMDTEKSLDHDEL